jgi:hypothetical protein
MSRMTAKQMADAADRLAAVLASGVGMREGTRARIEGAVIALRCASGERGRDLFADLGLSASARGEGPDNGGDEPDHP